MPKIKHANALLTTLSITASKVISVNKIQLKSYEIMKCTLTPIFS